MKNSFIDLASLDRQLSHHNRAKWNMAEFHFVMYLLTKCETIDQGDLGQQSDHCTNPVCGACLNKYTNKIEFALRKK